MATTSAEEFVIVGGGLTAATAVQTLREEGFAGAIRVIAAEPELPYERPPLSKGYLTGTDQREAIFPHDEAWYRDHDVEVRSGTRAVRLDLAEHRLDTDRGRLRYDRLLLATGATPRLLGLPGGDAAGIHVLRTVRDSEELRAELAPGGRRVVIVGAGWIGMEAAAAARGHGNEVVVVERGDVPLSRALGDELGTMFRDLHEQNGVTFRMRAGTRGFEVESGRVAGVVLDDGAVLPADVVVLAVGVLPDAALAAEAGLAVDDGILVDEHMRTADPDVYAAGDVANAHHPVLGERMRNEHWANAIAGGKTAARSMLGRDVVNDEIPYFFTDQYDLGMEYAGYPPLTTDADLVYRGDRAAREFIVFWHRDGRVVAGMNVNVWDVSDAVQELIRSARPIDPKRLADSSVDLGEL